MADDFGGTDSDQGTYGPVGPTSGSEPAPNPNQGPVGPAGPPGPTVIDAAVSGRLQRDSAITISLQPYNGRYFGVNGELVDLTGGLSRSQSDHLIDAAGLDAGSGAAVNTLYYVYVSNSKATFSPNSIRLSTTPPATVNGVKYLNSSGNGLNWRFIGWVYTISNGGTVNFADSLTQRLVINYYNRRPLSLFRCPGYVDDDTQTSYTEANGAVWREVHAGSSDGHVDYIATGEDAVQAEASLFGVVTLVATDYFEVGIGDNSATSAAVSASDSYDTTDDHTSQLNCSYKWTPAEGFSKIYLLGLFSAGVAGITVVADDPRNGSAADPAVTYIAATVMG